jgi:TPR repeat protein
MRRGRGGRVSNTSFAVAVITALVVGAASAADAATLDFARKADGTIVSGVRIEGEIVPGDAQRLLDFYAKYGIAISPVYLRSKGGDVEEAMRIGTIIRRLRLGTEVPVWDTGKPPVGLIKVDHPEDSICASACFLVYAGGATRFGNYLALHRPYLAREDARTLTDIEYEALQKAMIPKVKAYLVDMDVDQYWIDRMFAANSQEHYIPAWAEADNKVRHLMGMVPSLEEVVLSRCKEDPDVDSKLQAFRASRSGPLTPADIQKMKEIMQESDVFYECRKTVLSNMQNAAFERENEPSLAQKCAGHPSLTPSETDRAKALFAKGQAVNHAEEAERLALFTKYDAARTCRASALYEIQFAASQRWYQEAKNSVPKPPPLPVDENFDAKGLSAVDMTKRGKKAYEAERWDVAARWFRKAADLGDGEGMIGMSWIYGNGKGVPHDDAERVRWVRMAADHGSTSAMTSLGYAYENGEESVTQDYAEAMSWYRKAADLGDAMAMLDIGQVYNLGRGVPQNYAEAMTWFRKAVDGGNAFAMVQIGFLYAFGHGVPQDDEQTRFWMKKAAVSDDTIAHWAANDWLIDHPSP